MDVQSHILPTSFKLVLLWQGRLVPSLIALTFLLVLHIMRDHGKEGA